MFRLCILSYSFESIEIMKLGNLNMLDALLNEFIYFRRHNVFVCKHVEMGMALDALNSHKKFRPRD